MDFLGIGIGLPQLLVIFTVAFFVLGPDRLPEVARTLARGVRTLRGYAADVQGQFDGELGGIRDEFLGIQDDLISMQGSLRGSLSDIDSSLRSVQSEVQSAVTSSVVSLQGVREARQEGSSPVAAPDYAPAAPARSTPAPLASPSSDQILTSGEGSGLRLPDYRPS